MDSIKLIFFCLYGLFSIGCNAQKKAMTNQDFLTGYEKNNNTTATYFEAIEFYKKLAHSNANIQISEVGMTDSGFPLHEVVISSDGDFDPSSNRQKSKTILFINNAIHPGEPCGVDASMMLSRDVLNDGSLLSHTTLVIVPFYNIGGGLNRGSSSRANQDGPQQYGFRGNAKNLDLNRDFIKCDSKNAQSFNQVYNKWDPDVFIDNHTSNGADYQYSMTLIATQKEKLDNNIAQFMTENMLPSLYAKMKDKDWEMIPYVNANGTPDKGISGFLDLPRYSSGYAALHNAISFMPETHMLKPYKNRVESTYAFMQSMLEFLDNHGQDFVQIRQAAIENQKVQNTFSIKWELDKEKIDKLNFKGFEAKYKLSDVTGKERLYYDQSVPWEKEINFFNTYKSTLEIEKPKAYVFPQAYTKVAERLQWNGVEVNRIDKDMLSDFEMYYIDNYESVKFPYEGHYLHYDVKVDKRIKQWKYRKGDFIVYTGQAKDRYIVECLEPQSADSYFAWNFFDGILMQKEYFSSYVFEEIAAQLLETNPELKAEFEQKKLEDSEFSENARAQLTFLYKRSQHFEQTFQLYPVARLIK